MPLWRSESSRQREGVGRRPSLGASNTMTSLPAPCILVNSSCMARRIPYDPPLCVLLPGWWPRSRFSPPTGSIRTATSSTRLAFSPRRIPCSAISRVLHREDYSFGPLAKLVPTDFAVGWGRMSDSTVLADIEISQGSRFYFWRTENWPIPRDAVSYTHLRAHETPEHLVCR